MKDFKKILFPVDLSEVSPKIAPWVLATAQKYDAEVLLLFVARRFDQYSGLSVPIDTIENIENQIIKGAETKIEEFVDSCFKGYPKCRAKVVQGDAAEEILNYITSENVDLVIIGTHGRKGLERVLFGSVAERVIKVSPAPVLSINPYKVPEP
ncbi:MAG: universal stress protein [Deltaproteobacteria bacterium]|nr:universal stress protein [Deltaproteobacteria bacterium]MBW1818451.1 universal stress protein [Deltaproteobacteria bacterium]